MCIDCNDSLQINLPPAPSGINGQDGESAYVYIASADDASGTNFTYPQDPNQEYAAFLSTNTQLNPPIAANFTGLWVRVAGINGTNGTNGTNGVDGTNAGLRYNFLGYNTTPGFNTPTAGNIGFGGATTATTASIYINYTDSFGINETNTLTASLGGGSHKAILKIVKVGDPSACAFFSITSTLTFTGGIRYIGTYLASNLTTPFVPGDDIELIIIRTGETGPTGAAGSNGSNGSNGTNGAGYTATSSSSVLIGLGSKTFTTQAGLAYTAGARVRASYSADPTKYVEGICTSYSGTSLVMTSDNTAGAGTYNTWNINLAGDVGGSGASAGLVSASVTLTSAQIKSLNSSPQTFLAAPGAGKAYLVIGAYATMTYVSTAYTSANAIDILGGTTGNIYGTLSPNILTETSNAVYGFTDYQGIKLGINEALNLKSRTSNPATGDSDITFVVIYTTITV